MNNMTTFSPASGSPASGLDVPLASPALDLPRYPFHTMVAEQLSAGANDMRPKVDTANTNKNTTTANKNAKPGKPPGKNKPRKRVNTAEKRHQHNAIERQRRETLNGKFIVLARLLPMLASHRRPSKSAIVNGSISHLTFQREQRLLATQLLREMSAEHDELLQEVNEWRKAGGFALKERNSCWNDKINIIAEVENETFGTFAGCDGEDGDEDDDNDVQQEQQEQQEQTDLATALPVFTTQSTGLITPRPSTEMATAPASALLDNLFQPEPRLTTASSNTTFNWSTDFAWSITNGTQPAINSSFSFNPFGADQSANGSDSPATSQQGNVVTPPTFTEMMHASSASPSSSNGSHGVAAPVEEPKPVPTLPAALAQWTPAQILYAHQQLQLQRQQEAQQQQLRAQQQREQEAAVFAAAFPGPITPSSMNPNMFTQQLMSSMFNVNSTPPAIDQIEQWRRNAMAGMTQPPVHHQTSVHDLRNAVRLGMGAVGAPGWESQAVEGF